MMYNTGRIRCDQIPGRNWDFSGFHTGGEPLGGPPLRARGRGRSRGGQRPHTRSRGRRSSNSDRFNRSRSSDDFGSRDGFRDSSIESSRSSGQPFCNSERGRFSNRGRRGGARSRDNAKERKFPIGVKVLESLIEREPYIISVELLKKDSGYDILLDEQNIKEFKLCLVIKLLHKAVESRANADGTLNLMQISFENQNFVNNLIRYVSEVKYDATKALEYLPLLYEIMEYYLHSTPMTAFMTISNLTDLVVGAIQQLKLSDPLSIQNLEQSFTNLSLQVQESRAKFRQSQTPRRSCKPHDLGSEDPPDDFRELEVIPTCDELTTTDRPFVRPQIVEGAFKDHDHYLDIQFRLLKEDFVRPLREGLQLYLNSSNQSERNYDVRIYSDVTLGFSEVAGTTITHFLKLNIKKNFKIENSKRFMFGNIICISADNFKSMVIASVCSRDELKNRLIGVTLETDSFQLCGKQKYTILESKAYFVAYKHTLNALKNVTRVPLEDYIIHVQNVVDPPNYLDANTVYVILKPETSENLNRMGLHIRNQQLTGNRLRVLNDIEYWPTCISMGLDVSQRRALHGALTRKMAIIQGPPGTGKTFLGLQIARTLIHNKDIWSGGNKHPILVVCYTNHALDQFLEGILSFTKNIVRIGSRSKNESLMEYQIQKKIYINKRDDDSRAINRQYFEIKHELTRLKDCLRQVNHLIHQKEPGILDLDTLTQFRGIVPHHMKHQLQWITMEHFLIDFNLEDGENFLGDESIVKEKSLKISIEQKNKEQVAREDFDLDHEIMAEEEYDRRLYDEEEEEREEMDVQELKSIKKIKNSTAQILNYKPELTLCEIDQGILQFSSQLHSDDPMVIYEAQRELNILYMKRNILVMTGRISWTQDECEFLEQQYNINQLDFVERWKLYYFWRSKLAAMAQELKLMYEKEFNRLTKTINSLRDLRYLDLMKKLDVVGMTTTGAAQYCNLLHDLGPPIVIVEEAAEIMESHVISALSDGCQHLILIGDHQQLRPKPNVYELGIRYHLDVSLFERMVRNDVQYEALEYQHRMKPMFSNLLVPTIYEDLKDHESVLQFPKVKGVKPDLFFLDHQEFESFPTDDAETFENLYEAKFLMGLCRHLMFQGYSADDVTIITPYSGQHRCLKKLQKENRFYACSNVRISILDNYQGEESNIILLSLVRSNPQEKVGFVKTDNRICVALSRAKHGMYIVGNMSQMSKASDLWSKIKDKLLTGGHIGPRLQLACENHPHQLINVSSYEDILAKAPEGGCNLPCSEYFPDCLHRCPRTCHLIDLDHSKLNCTVRCPKILCGLGHQCPKLCYEDCQPCQVLVSKTLPCTHTHAIPCFMIPEAYKCPTLVEKELTHCKHVVTVECNVDPSTYKCPKKCTTRLDCGHQCKLTCHPRQDPNHETYDCFEACESSPENCTSNHPCKKRCYEECGICTVEISRHLKCGHTMPKTRCGVPEEDLVCPSNCKRILECGHRCSSRCGDPCANCSQIVEKEVPECKHKVKIACSKNPTSRHCSGKCTKMLPCSHPCQNKCNETCTPKCVSLVKTSLQCPRGHTMNLPCHVLKSISAVNNNSIILKGKTVGDYCDEICGGKLDCGHSCLAKCGSCLNGRLHATCQKKCEKTLVCGHLCKSPCSVDCPPCQENCFWKCSHSACKKKCGLPCNPCKVKCPRSCKHLSCSNKCGEKCSSKPCYEPCELVTLPCKHPCIGYCGEPCPPLCRICDNEEVTEIMFGDEDEEDARFVLLEDCGHVLEGGGLETWMKLSYKPGERERPVEIGMKKCPKCNAPIYSTKRFQEFILQSYANVKKVKNKHFQKKKIPDQRVMINDLKDLSHYWPIEVATLRSKFGLDVNYMKKKRGKKLINISDRQIALYAFQLDFLKQAKDVNGKLEGKSDRLSKLVATVMSHREAISNRTMDEVSCELRRLEICSSVQKLETRAVSYPNVRLLLNKIKSLMDPTIKFDQSLEKKVVDVLKEAEKYAGSLGISDTERIQIVAAMGLTQGHWFKCPNGHVYCIDACGGPMEEATCPDCKAVIGGTQHRFRGDNRLASEMDGASRSAWPGGPNA